jgi:hypothetical protein
MDRRETEMVAELQSQVAALQSENDYLKARLIGAGLMAPPAAMPSAAEVDRLLSLVGTAYPRLIPPEDEAATHRRHFINAIQYLQFCRRSDKRSVYDTRSHIDECCGWLKHYNIDGGCSLRGFCAACAASDVRVNLNEYPHGSDVGLSVGTTSQAVAGWKTVLSRNAPAPPLESRRPVSRPTQLNVIQPSIVTVR